MHQTLLTFPTTKKLVVKEGVVLEQVAQVIGRTAILFLRKFLLPAAKRVSDDLLEIAVPEVAVVASGEKIFKTAAKSVGRQTLRKQLGGGIQKRSTPFKTLGRSSRSRRDFFTNIANY